MKGEAVKDRYDIFKLATVYGMHFPTLGEAREVKIVKNTWFFYMKDMATGIVACETTLEKCKDTLAGLISLCEER
jgi:hypothetical protein